MAILILRQHSLDISMSLACVVGSNRILNCSARPALFHCLKILKSPAFISVAAVKLVRCCAQVANLQPVLSSFFVALICCRVRYFVIKPKAQTVLLEMQQLRDTKWLPSQKLLVVFETTRRHPSEGS